MTGSRKLGSSARRASCCAIVRRAWCVSRLLQSLSESVPSSMLSILPALTMLPVSIASGWYAKISEGAYGAVIRDALLKAVVERPPLKVSAIADRCQALMTRRGGSMRARAELTAACAACLRLYQQSNYSGPLPSDETLKLVEGYAPKLLDVGGDAPSPFVTVPGALTLALALLEAANEGAASWWLVRAKTLHARCLVTGSHRVCGTFVEAISKHAADARKWLEGASNDTRALLELEIGLAEHFLDEPGRGSVPASESFTLRRPRRWRPRRPRVRESEWGEDHSLTKRTR